MNEVVGSCDILFVCLDTLRYDVAKEEQERGNTPVLNRYGVWTACQAPGNFTYPSHHAMFSGFLPCELETRSILKRKNMLFFPKNIGLGKKGPEGAFVFEGGTFVEGLRRVGYRTCCVGGVAFFDKRSDIGRVFPNLFEESYWYPAFGCAVKESTTNQVDFILKKLENMGNSEKKQPIFLYLNVDAIHYPNAFYVEGEKHDSVKTHAAALRYVDKELGRLFEGWTRLRGKSFVICTSDHGTCYGEDGCEFHGINHPMVNTIPYKHFFIKSDDNLLAIQ
ncbi:MAG: STM4013/SEN3800 family hydrolase [bacterium]|nr:STM4013/SEN3800 family hydrolase [bacterium]